MCGGIELSRYQPRHEAAEGRADLVASRGEILAHHQHDLCLHARQFRRQDNEIRFAEQSAGFLRFVFPGNAEQVERIHFPQSHVFQPVTDLFRDGFRIRLDFKRQFSGRRCDFRSLSERGGTGQIHRVRISGLSRIAGGRLPRFRTDKHVFPANWFTGIRYNFAEGHIVQIGFAETVIDRFIVHDDFIHAVKKTLSGIFPISNPAFNISGENFRGVHGKIDMVIIYVRVLLHKRFKDFFISLSTVRSRIQIGGNGVLGFSAYLCISGRFN